VEFLAALFVGKPLNILAVGLVFLGGHLLLRYTVLGPGRPSRALLVAAAAWALCAAWEWLVKVRTPEANIRVDLLVLWPLLLVLSVVAVVVSTVVVVRALR
jgi:hypothetical protein